MAGIKKKLTATFAVILLILGGWFTWNNQGDWLILIIGLILLIDGIAWAVRAVRLNN